MDKQTERKNERRKNTGNTDTTTLCQTHDFMFIFVCVLSPYFLSVVLPPLPLTLTFMFVSDQKQRFTDKTKTTRTHKVCVSETNT